MEWSLSLALLWFALVSAGCAVCWTPAVRRWSGALRHPLLVAALVAVVVRVVPAMMALPADALVQWDLESYRVVADAVAHRRDVYDLPGRYPYLPVHMYVFVAADWAANATHVPFLFMVKLPAIAADAVIVVLVGRGAAALGRRQDSAALALICALNPLSVLTTGYHGQFDAIPLALTLAAWEVLAFRRAWWALPVAAMLFGLAVADKTWPALLGPVLLWRLAGARARLVFGSVAVLPSIVALALYERLIPGGALHALEVVSSYQGVVGAWGFSELLVRAAGAGGRDTAIHHAAVVGVWLLAGILALAYVAAARLRHDPERIALILVSVYAAAAGWGVHWLAWLAPAAVLSGRRWGALYVAATSAYAASIYFGFGGIFWAVVYATNSLEPVQWSRVISLALWACMTAALAATCIVTLAPVWAARTRASVRDIATEFHRVTARRRPAESHTVLPAGRESPAYPLAPTLERGGQSGPPA